MSDLSISTSYPLTVTSVQRVLRSTNLTNSQKADFIRKNSCQINSLVNTRINSDEFKAIMQNRPLELFKPIKNSFTKRGDKKILAKSLEIEPKDIDSTIQGVSKLIENGQDLSAIPKDKMEAMTTYVYRHGTKDQVVNFLDHELGTAKDVVGTLYKNLEYYNGGLADYFIRPIHRMDNTTLVNMYNVVDKNLTKSAQGKDDAYAEQINMASEWALMRIYEIQNNSKLSNAIKLRDKLS